MYPNHALPRSLDFPTSTRTWCPNLVLEPVTRTWYPNLVPGPGSGTDAPPRFELSEMLPDASTRGRKNAYHRTIYFTKVGRDLFQGSYTPNPKPQIPNQKQHTPTPQLQTPNPDAGTLESKLDADEAGDPVVVAGLRTEVRVHRKTKAIHECQIV